MKTATKTPNIAAWMEPGTDEAIKDLIAALGITPGTVNDKRITLGDATVQEARIYLMPLDPAIMNACADDTTLYTLPALNKGLAAAYLKHLKTRYQIPDATVLRMGGKQIHLNDVLKALEQLAKQWGVVKVLFANGPTPGLNLYGLGEGTLLQFCQPRHRHQF